MADALYKEDSELGLFLADVIDQYLAPMNSAVGGVKDANITALLQQENQELIQSVESDLLSHFGAGFVGWIKEFGGLVHLALLGGFVGSLLTVEVELRGLIDNNIRRVPSV